MHKGNSNNFFSFFLRNRGLCDADIEFKLIEGAGNDPHTYKITCGKHTATVSFTNIPCLFIAMKVVSTISRVLMRHVIALPVFRQLFCDYILAVLSVS